MRRLAGNDLEVPEEYLCGLWQNKLSESFVKHKCKAHKMDKVPFCKASAMTLPGWLAENCQKTKCQWYRDVDATQIIGSENYSKVMECNTAYNTVEHYTRAAIQDFEAKQ
jgi:hypothetical protein